MNMTFLNCLCIAGSLALASAAPARADEPLLDGGWNGRATLVSQALDAVLEQDHSVPVLTTAALPPRRPKTFANVAPRSARPAAVAVQQPVLRVAAAAPTVKRQPLFWMTVGNGF